MLKLKIKDNTCSTNRKGKDYKILPEKILKLFPEVVSELFLNDNINEITQKEFEIRYDKGEFNNEKLCMRFVWICL